MSAWFQLRNTENIISPALLFFPERINRNIDKMIAIAANDPGRLRPHVKTYKCKEIVEMQLQKGISKFKCATLSELEMLLACGVRDVLVAYPLIGPAQHYLKQLAVRNNKTRFSVLVDHIDQVEEWKKIAPDNIGFFVDLDVGMHRTGIAPEKAHEVVDMLHQSGFTFRGIQAYDGHIHDPDLAERTGKVDLGFEAVQTLLKKLDNKGLEILCGGSISFPVHARYPERTLSPGTTLLWDQGYSENIPDLDFEVAACLLCRVISKPGKNSICVDLGHKAVGSEMSAPPVYFPQFPEARLTVHSEEHLVLEFAGASSLKIGEVLYGIPRHICPTVALHEEAQVVENGVVTDQWKIVSRKRIYHYD